MRIVQPFALNPALLADPARAWRRMARIETVSGDVSVVSDALSRISPQKLVYAEGDSWFDKFTPIPAQDTNLIDAILTPFRTAVVDVSNIGDEVRDMIRGHQARQTHAMFRLFDFDAILLSAGGNDLKNVFADLLQSNATADAAALERLTHPGSFSDFFDEVMANIGRFVELRDSARSTVTRAAPIFIHGYDYLQPRPAGAALFTFSRIGGGPWLFPAMQAAGLDAAAMRSTADAMIDEMNDQLRTVIAPLPNVHVIDQRGLLAPAAPGSTGSNADWLDEIHPNATGFVKLARNRWDVALATALGWSPGPEDLVPALDATNTSTASTRMETAIA